MSSTDFPTFEWEETEWDVSGESSYLHSSYVSAFQEKLAQTELGKNATLYYVFCNEACDDATIVLRIPADKGPATAHLYVAEPQALSEQVSVDTEGCDDDEAVISRLIFALRETFESTVRELFAVTFPNGRSVKEYLGNLAAYAAGCEISVHLDHSDESSVDARVELTANDSGSSEGVWEPAALEIPPAEEIIPIDGDDGGEYIDGAIVLNRLLAQQDRGIPWLPFTAIFPKDAISGSSAREQLASELFLISILKSMGMPTTRAELDAEKEKRGNAIFLE